MQKDTTINSTKRWGLKTYTFKVVLEKDKWPDEPNEKAVWRASIPALEHKGAASWGYTQEEALENLQNAVDLLIEYMLKIGEITTPQASYSPYQRKIPMMTLTV